MADDLDHPKEGRYAAADWRREYSADIVCPECEGPILYKDWEDNSARVIATHYRCPTCQINWWSDA